MSKPGKPPTDQWKVWVHHDGNGKLNGIQRYRGPRSIPIACLDSIKTDLATLTLHGKPARKNSGGRTRGKAHTKSS